MNSGANDKARSDPVQLPNGTSTSARILARNSAFNLGGQVVPLLVALATTPYVIHRLGTDRFGILSLGWIVLGYMGLFDLGLGRSTTRFVAEALGRGRREEIGPLIATSLAFIVPLGLLAGGLLAGGTPFLVHRLLKIPGPLTHEAEMVFFIAAGSVVFTLAGASLSGVLEAHQRFDVTNGIRVPSSVMTYLIPAVAIKFGAGLPVIAALLLAKNVTITAIFAYVVQRLVPLRTARVDAVVFRKLFSFGVWIAVHNVAVAILLDLDRVLVGVFLSVSAVTFYSVPYELVNRTSFIPSAIMVVLFPAFSSLTAVDPARLQDLFDTALKYLALIMGLILTTLIVFSRDILVLWLGWGFAQSAGVLRMLAIGVFMSSIAWLLGTLIQGVGDPKPVSLIHVLQVPYYCVATWLLIKAAGTTGAALSWTLRMGITVILLAYIARKQRLLRPRLALRNGSGRLVCIFSALALAGYLINTHLPGGPATKVLFLAVYMGTSLLIVWKIIFNDRDRKFIRAQLSEIDLSK